MSLAASKADEPWVSLKSLTKVTQLILTKDEPVVLIKVYSFIDDTYLPLHSGSCQLSTKSMCCVPIVGAVTCIARLLSDFLLSPALPLTGMIPAKILVCRCSYIVKYQR